MNKQKGFTLIELVIVIIILGFLSAVALPKFLDLSGDAEDAAANGVLAAVSTACVIQFAKNRVDSALSDNAALITDGAKALAALTQPPTGWAAGTDTATIVYTGNDAVIYTITITPEDVTTPCLAVLTSA